VINFIDGLSFETPLTLCFCGLEISARVAFVSTSDSSTVLGFSLTPEQKEIIAKLKKPIVRDALARSLRSNVGTPEFNTLGGLETETVSDKSVSKLNDRHTSDFEISVQADWEEATSKQAVVDRPQADTGEHLSVLSEDVLDESQLLAHITNVTRIAPEPEVQTQREIELVSEPLLLPSENVLLFADSDQFLNQYDAHISRGAIFAQGPPLALGIQQRMTLSIPSIEVAVEISGRIGHVKDGKVGIMLDSPKAVKERLESLVSRLRSG